MIHELEVPDTDFPGRRLSLARVRPDGDGPPVWSLAIVTAEDQWPIAVSLSMENAARVGSALVQERLALASDVVEALREALSVLEYLSADASTRAQCSAALAAWDASQPPAPPPDADLCPGGCGPCNILRAALPALEAAIRGLLDESRAAHARPICVPEPAKVLPLPLGHTFEGYEAVPCGDGPECDRCHFILSEGRICAKSRAAHASPATEVGE